MIRADQESTPGRRYPLRCGGLGGFRALLLAVLMLPGIVLAAESDIRGPDVTIIASEEETIYEYRQGGQLRMVKVVPKWGKPYYLVPADNTRGYGDLERAKTLIPSWVIVEF